MLCEPIPTDLVLILSSGLKLFLSADLIGTGGSACIYIVFFLAEVLRY